MNFVAKPGATPDQQAETGMPPDGARLSLWRACKVPALFSIMMLAVVISLTGDLRAIFVVIGLFVMSSAANFFAGKINIL